MVWTTATHTKGRGLRHYIRKVPSFLPRIWLDHVAIHNFDSTKLCSGSSPQLQLDELSVKSAGQQERHHRHTYHMTQPPSIRTHSGIPYFELKQEIYFEPHPLTFSFGQMQGIRGQFQFVLSESYIFRPLYQLLLELLLLLFTRSLQQAGESTVTHINTIAPAILHEISLDTKTRYETSSANAVKGARVRVMEVIILASHTDHAPSLPAPFKGFIHPCYMRF